MKENKLLKGTKRISSEKRDLFTDAICDTNENISAAKKKPQTQSLQK